MIKSRPSPPLGDFEERLLSHLTTVVAQRAHDLAGEPATDIADRTPAVRRTWQRRLVPVTATATLVSTGVVVGIALMAPDAQPAYAVEKLPDGSVQISVNDTSQLEGLTERLKVVGVGVRVVPFTTSCREPALPPAKTDVAVVIQAAERGTTRIRVYRPVPAGQFLVIGIGSIRTPDGDTAYVAPAGLTAHPPTCQPAPVGADEAADPSPSLSNLPPLPSPTG